VLTVATFNNPPSSYILGAQTGSKFGCLYLQW